MECKLKNRSELIGNYITGDLPEDEIKFFEEHYFQCEVCFKELKIAEEALNIIKNEGPDILNVIKPVSSSGTKRDTIRKFKLPGFSSPVKWGIAFTAIAALLIFLLIFTRQNDQVILPDNIITEDTDNKNLQDEQLHNEELLQKDKDLIAELTGPAFTPSPYFEEWITENVRAGSDKIEFVSSPETEEKFQDEDISFRWRMANEEIISLKIMNNLEEEIFISKPDQSQFPDFNVKVSSKIFKQSGLYYWRIEDENEVLYVGKFYILK